MEAVADRTNVFLQTVALTALKEIHLLYIMGKDSLKAYCKRVIDVGTNLKVG